MSWLAALGDAAIDFAGRRRANREEDREIERQEQARQMELARMALMQDDAALRREEIGRNRAKDVLEAAGPNGVLDEVGAKTVQEGGFGFRLSPQEATLGAKFFTPGLVPGSVEQEEVAGQQAGMRVVPTAAQASELEERGAIARERTRQQQVRDLISSDVFGKQPYEKRQQMWAMAGYPGQIPQTLDDQKAIIDYQHGLEMQKINRMYPPDRFGGGGGGLRGRNVAEQDYFANVDKVTDNIRAEYNTAIMAAANAGDWQRVQQFQKDMRRDIETAVGRIPRPSTLPPQVSDKPAMGGDDIDTYLGSLPEAKLQVIVKNIANPQFRAELQAEEGVDADQVMARLQQSGFLQPQAGAPPAPGGPAVSTPTPPPTPGGSVMGNITANVTGRGSAKPIGPVVDVRGAINSYRNFIDQGHNALMGAAGAVGNVMGDALHSSQPSLMDIARQRLIEAKRRREGQP